MEGRLVYENGPQNAITEGSAATAKFAIQNDASEDYLSDDTENNYDYSDLDSSYEDDDESYQQEIPEVDKRNLHIPQKVSYYAEKIIQIAIDSEPEYISTCEFIAHQNTINQNSRRSVMKWIINTVQTLCFSADVLYNAAVYIDVILCTHTLCLEELKYISATCLWIASKIDLGRSNFLQSFGSKDEQAKVIEFEPRVIQQLNCFLDYPTSKLFLRRYIEVLGSDMKIIEAGNFFNEVALLMLSMLDFKNNVVAAASMCLAHLCQGRFCPTNTLIIFGHIEDINELKICAQILLVEAGTVIDKKEDVLWTRFSSPELSIKLADFNTSLSILSNL